MISGLAAMVRRGWRQHRLALGILSLALSLFAWVLTRVAPAPDELGFLAGLFSLLPPQMLALAGGELGLGSARGVIAFGYLHPFFLTLLSAWTIRVTSAALAGEMGRGTMDLLASRPIERHTHVLAAWLLAVGGLAVMLASAWTGTAIGLAMRPLRVSAGEIVAVPAMAWCLFAAWTGVALFVSATRREAGTAIGWTTAILALSFVWDFLARVWAPMSATRTLSLFAYYRPQEVVAHGVAPEDAMRLGVVAVIFLAAAVLVFRRRDL